MTGKSSNGSRDDRLFTPVNNEWSVLKRSAREEVNSKKKVPLRAVAAVLIAGALIFSYQKLLQPSVNQEKFSSALTLARHKYEQGESLLHLNKLRAREVLLESEGELTRLRDTLKEGQREYEQATGLLSKVQEALKTASAAYKVEPQLLFDLNLIRDGMRADDMESEGNTLYLYSSNLKLIAILQPETKENKVVAGGKSLSGGEHLTVGGDKQYLFTNGEVIEAESGKNVLPDRGGEDEDSEDRQEVNEIADIKAFGGNLYLLSKNGEILKYVPAEEGLVRQEYLKRDVNFDNATSFAIDGNIWVAADGLIYKYVGGRRDNFVMRGLEEPLSKETVIFKTQDLNNLYLLDRKNSRIVVVDEEGNYIGEYSYEGLADTDAYVVSADEEKIYLLQSNKLYTIALR